MDKLELKDIAPYYAYELLFMSKYKTIHKLGIHNEMRGKGIESRTIDQCLEMMPILRPMSDLTKEITHNGEKFVPMLYLAGIEDINYQYLDDDKEGEPIIGIDESDFDMGSMTYARTKRFVYDKDLKCFAIDIYDEGGELEYRESFASKSYELLQVLYKLHFDVNDLIGRGLAINLNEVDNGK
ncbi:hypothetical protein HZQ14_15790 [Elizabethkingia anophelis]|uniref:hypothetical protein n=1 Tax=Elizabethkingia anophelis TaxID=1117645 RepID=UPI0021A6ED80|nr:hypothetical protein [Elizabethkingia anophelis]